MLKRLVESYWKLPLGAAAVLALCFAVLWVGAVAHCAWGGLPQWLQLIIDMTTVLFLLAVLAGSVVPVWLVAMTVVWLRRADLWSALNAWGASLLAGVVAYFVFVGVFGVFVFGAVPDFYASGLVVPPDKEFVIPRGMTFFTGEQSPPAVVQALRDKQPGWPEVKVDTADAAAVPVPNLLRLTRETPDLLHEYVLRCLYAEAANLRFCSPLLGGPDGMYLAHELSPLKTAHRTGGDSCTVLHLPNGWSLECIYGQEEGSARSVRMLDDVLAPLAQNPTAEQLDALLPPLPPHPFLWMSGGLGMYQMLLVIPASYEEGKFELRAHEFTTGKPVEFRQRWRGEVRLGKYCRLICSDGSNTVYSGEWGEFYGSEWEIWFTPAAGGEARCVNRQAFLMQGYSR